MKQHARYLFLSMMLLLATPVLHSAELPEKYVALDSNENGFLEVEEIESVIDAFFTQSGNFDVPFIHDLIDFFFDQP